MSVHCAEIARNSIPSSPYCMLHIIYTEFRHTFHTREKLLKSKQIICNDIFLERFPILETVMP